MENVQRAAGDSTEDEADTQNTDWNGARIQNTTRALYDQEGTDDDVSEHVAEDMRRFEQSFKNIGQRYRLINRIGEGTFSTVYKAEDLQYEHARRNHRFGVDREIATNNSGRTQFVAIKKIYVTSSPLRIMNELELLHDLRESPNVCPLLTAFRHQDQVIAILPYFEHRDFRDYYRDFSISEIRIYFHSLFTALASVHKAEIIHRDIKPTNFLYCPTRRRGVLVDFGLAERAGTDYSHCLCCCDIHERQRRTDGSVYMTTFVAAESNNQPQPRPTYPNNDQRGSRRANRAGTRGFRAPEVLLKCTAQTCLIDVWSCGVILLTFLTKRFPFFHSADDIDAFIELSTLYGRKRMSEVAALHGQIMQTNIPTISERGYSWEKIISWCNERPKKRSDGSVASNVSLEETEAIDFLKCCMELDHTRRITASDALEHRFLNEVLR